MSNVTTANRDIKSLQPIAQQAARLFLDTCKARGVDIFVTEYHRSQERQNYLYEQGRSRPGQIVTWTRSSNHTSGYAWDIAVSPPHALYDSNIITKAGQAARELGIEWGGDWKQKDTPHFQVSKDWKAPVKIDETYKRAVENLVLEGVINTPVEWYPKPNLKYVDTLIKRMGVRLFDVHGYQASINKMVTEGIINSPQIWINKQYREKSVKDLMVKVSMYLG